LKQPLREKGVEATRVHEELSSRMLTRMQGLKTIRAHGLEDREKKTFSDLSKNVAKVFTRISVVDLYLRPANDICIILCIAALIWYSSYIGNPVTITATVIALLYKLRPYILGIEGALTVIIRSQGPLKAILKQLSIPGLRLDPEDAVPPPQNWQTLRFDRVSFGYDENALILKDLSFVLNRNETVVIRGVSGAGKSTLINLILKLVDPVSGTITIDEQPFDKIARIPWLSRLAAAGQDFDLLDGTLRENLTFGRNISDEKIFEALKIAEIHEFVQSLPEGLGTKIGDRGFRLSGGQRQRIILARALSGHPQLLIMDEATSAVSLDVEAKIHRNIRTYYPDMTIILITHRTLGDDFATQEIWVNNSPVVSAKQAAVS
jgi:ABC-type multidrug transport system fused ATPase/permease subunit